MNPSWFERGARAWITSCCRQRPNQPKESRPILRIEHFSKFDLEGPPSVHVGVIGGQGQIAYSQALSPSIEVTKYRTGGIACSPHAEWLQPASAHAQFRCVHGNSQAGSQEIRVLGRTIQKVNSLIDKVWQHSWESSRAGTDCICTQYIRGYGSC